MAREGAQILSVVFSVHPVPGTTFPILKQKTLYRCPKCSFSVNSVHFVHPVPGTLDNNNVVFYHDNPQ